MTDNDPAWEKVFRYDRVMRRLPSLTFLYENTGKILLRRWMLTGVDWEQIPDGRWRMQIEFRRDTGIREYVLLDNAVCRFLIYDRMGWWATIRILWLLLFSRRLGR